MVGAGYTEREVCDGQGLSSLGRWSHEDRLYPSSSLWLQIQRMFIHTAETMTTSRHLSELALGRLTSSPFSEKTVTVLRDDLFRLLSDSGHGIVRGPQDRRELLFDFRLFHSLLSAAGDPEVKMREFAVGVRVGPGTKLPRCPQIYSKKKKWRMQEQREQQEVDEQLAARGVWNTNYSSVHPVKQQVLDVLRDQAKRGQVLVLSQQVAKKRFPGLVVASMGAVKKEKDGVISARVVFDGTNGFYVNNSTHLRDQERSPVAGDIKRFMREKARVGEPTFGLTADIKEAHRQIPIHPSDWHLLASRLEPDGEVFINTVGTFGISSASYWWSRVSTAMGRLYQYIVARYASSWVLLLADDYHIEMGGRHFRPALLVFFLLCDVVCCPLSWSKTSGGLITNWVGFELLLKEHALGLSERRPAWFISWARNTANTKVVHIRYFEEALGRAVFVASALELLRPFLSPLYAFSCSGSREGVRPLPPYVSFFLRFLARSVERNRHTMCAAETRKET